MKVIAAFPTLELAHLARSRLESAGLEVEVRDESTISLYWLYSAALGGVRLAVREEEVHAAQEILREPPSDEGILVCPHCGSRDVSVRLLSPAGAFLTLISLPIPLPLQTADCRSCKKSHDIKAHPN